MLGVLTAPVSSDTEDFSAAGSAGLVKVKSLAVKLLVVTPRSVID